MKAHDVVLIGSLADRCPALLPVLQQHVDEWDGLLSHLFMADLSRWAVERYLADPDDKDLACLLEQLEAAYAAGREDDTEIIAVSFLENLPSRDEEASGLRDVLGPALTEQLQRDG